MMRIGILALVVIAFSGCALMTKKLPAPCGATDYIATHKGTVITGVDLPTDETGKKYNVVTPKEGFWISLECDNRLGR